MNANALPLPPTTLRTDPQSPNSPTTTPKQVHSSVEQWLRLLHRTRKVWGQPFVPNSDEGSVVLPPVASADLDFLFQQTRSHNSTHAGNGNHYKSISNTHTITTAIHAGLPCVSPCAYLCVLGTRARVCTAVYLSIRGSTS